MSSKKTTGSQSASDWYQQIMTKIPTSDQSTKVKGGKKSTRPTPTAEPNHATLLDEPIEAPKPVKTGLLLSERTDIWSAVDSMGSRKANIAVPTKFGGVKRKMDNKIAKMEAADVDGDDFLANLMKNRTGDAFDDLVAQMEELKQQQKIEKQVKAGQSGVKKLVKKVTIVEKNNVAVSAKPSIPALATPVTKSTPSLASVSPKSSLKNKKIVEAPIEQTVKKQRVAETTKPSSKIPTAASKSTKDSKNPIVQLVAPTVPIKPAGWTPQCGKYYADKSKIGTSRSFDNFQKSLPAWFMEPAYQLEVRRLVDSVNTMKKYTPSPMSQWFPKVEKVQPPPQPQEESEEEEEENKQEEEEYEEEEVDLNSSEDDVDIEFEDVEDGEGFFSDEEQFEDDDDEDTEADPFGNDVTPELSTTSQLRAISAPLSHQILLLPSTEDRIEALRDFHQAITDQEEHSRMKTKMVIVVRDGRVANQLICKIGLRVTKHRKNNRGMSNAGLTVETKGVEMLHERYNDQQRRKALEKFHRGGVQTLIVTDDFLSMLWPYRASIGIMVHYDIPLHRDQQSGKKTFSKIEQMSNMTKAEILQQAQVDKVFTQNHTIATMQERLGYCQRSELNFPDSYYVKQYSPVDKTKLLAKLPNPKKPFKNVSLTFLGPTRACQLYAEHMAGIYANQYKAVKTAEALEQFALQKPTQ